MSEATLSPGTLIDYRDGDGITSGVVVGIERNRLLVVSEKGRTDKITPARVAFVVEAPSGRGAAPSHQVAADRAGDHARRAAAAAVGIDVPSLWEVLVDEGGTHRLEDLAALGAPHADGPSGGAVLRALVADRLHFQRKDAAWTPRTREAVVGIRAQRERERARTEARARFVERARTALAAAAVPPAAPTRAKPETIENPSEGDQDEDEKAISRSIESLAVRGSGALESKGAASLVGEIGSNFVTPEEGAFRIGVVLGIFNPHENLYLRRFGIRTAFPPRVILAAEQAGRLNPVLKPEADSPLRDLRAEDAFTIDDEETVELDDALHVRIENDGTVSLGVHIADPSTFISPGDPVDLEAAERGTSHYLPDRRIPMIPPSISEGVASLAPGEDRPALSFLVRFSPTGERLSWEIAPTIIRSRRRIDYAEANGRLRADAEIEEPFASLARIARALESERREHGAVRIAAPEVEAYPAEDGVVRLRRVDPDRPARRLVAEMMVLAGRLAAEFCTLSKIPVLYRKQAPPDRPVPALPEGSYDPVATRQARRAMRRSEISTVAGPHSGLGLDAYVQATSPLRRYTDLVAHRQIRASLFGRKPPYDAEALQRIAASSEEIERASRTTEKGSDEFWILRYLEERTGEVVEAVVLDRGERKTDIELTATLLSASIPPRPDHSPGDTMRLVIERVAPRAGSISLREVP